jgi:hypothetical protein
MCIQVTTAACTPPTQNSIEVCSIDVEKEHTDGHLLLLVLHSVMDPVKANSKNEYILPFDG